MDPADGIRRSFRNTQLNSLLSRGGALIFHDPNQSFESQIEKPNQTEPMELGSCNYLTQNLDHFCEINLSSVFNKINRFVRQINNNQCPVINADNPFFQKNDVFEVDYQFLSNDKIKLKISLKTALGIEKMFFENNQHKFKEYLKELFKKIPKNDNTGAGGSIKNDDYDLMKNFIFNNYSYFHNAIKDLQNNNNKYNFILVDINRETKGLKSEAIKLV